MIKPILFSTPMVQAILEDRKGQTRRIVKKKYSNTDIEWKEDKYGKRLIERQNDLPDPVVNPDGSTTHRLRAFAEIKPKYKKGDILWVRETYREIEQDVGKPRYEYKATEKINLIDKWKPSIFMPKDAARIFLEVTKVRIERLQDISEEDAIAEGLYSQNFTGWGDEPHLPHFPEPTVYRANNNRDWSEYAIGEFQYIWDSINGNWSENPFVFVYDFKQVEKPENF